MARSGTLIAGVCLALTAAPPATAQERMIGAVEADDGTIDWTAVEREAARLLGRYIRLDTTNPPGREIDAARFLRDVLIEEGIEFLILEEGDGKAFLVGRLPARRAPRRGGVILLNHMDVVDASPEHWSVEPFAGRTEDGFVWGRGALDMKGMAVAELMALVLLGRHGPALDRDIVFLATSDEEIMGGTDAGVFVERHRDLIADAEFVINEGGTVRVDEDRALRYYGVGVTEKSPFWQRVTARGPAGHGSIPIDSSAVNRLVGALERIRTWETELKVTPPVAAFFEGLAEIVPPAEASLYRNIDSTLADPVARGRVLSDRFHNAILRNTVSITALTGSPKTNVIPPEAHAELDIRLLPGERPEDVQSRLRDVAGADGESLTIEPTGVTWPATSSPTDSEMFRAIEATARAFDPGAAVLPYVLAGFTDSHYFREIGIDSYGVGLFRLPPSESARIHGNDERVSVANLGFGTRFLYEVLVRVGGGE